MSTSVETSRQHLVRWMDEAWESGLWAAPWKRALEGISAQQAAWRPGPGRNCIWEIVNHICFWREHQLRKLAGQDVSKQEVEQRNFEMPPAVTEDAWRDAEARFERTHRQFRAALADDTKDLKPLEYLIPHDSYHIGQIMTLRAMQGMKPIV